MPRVRRDRVFDAGADRYREFYHRRRELADEQRALSARKAALNREAADAGVHTHVLNDCTGSQTSGTWKRAAP